MFRTQRFGASSSTISNARTKRHTRSRFCDGEEDSKKMPAKLDVRFKQTHQPCVFKRWVHRDLQVSLLYEILATRYMFISGTFGQLPLEARVLLPFSALRSEWYQDPARVNVPFEDCAPSSTYRIAAPRKMKALFSRVVVQRWRLIQSYLTSTIPLVSWPFNLLSPLHLETSSVSCLSFSDSLHTLAWYCCRPP